MTKEEKEKYNKKIKIYEMLGAEKFQKIVFTVERLKYKVIKKCFPNFIDFYDKQCDKQEKKLLKKAKTEEDIEKIKRDTKFSKLAIRKEMLEEKNRNYHMDTNRPTDIYKYLEWNKKIHEKGLLKDIIIIAITSVAIACGLTIAIPVLIAELLSAGINFECINIQNYSICKYKRCEEALEKKEQKKVMNNIDNYGKAAEVIDQAITSSDKLPSMSEIISQIKDPEQLKQMKQMLVDLSESREKEKTKQKVRGK